MPDLSALRSAYTALSTHQRRIEIIAQNIANADTPGYTRQRADLSAVAGLESSAMIAGLRPPRGVEISNITRITDDLLERGARDASGRFEVLSEQARAASAIEQRLGRLDDDSLSSQLEVLWNTFADIANDPNDPGSRQVALQQAHHVSAIVNDLAASAATQRSAEAAALGARVAEVNDLATNIASVGRSIVAASAAGVAPNELLDRQATLVNRLSELLDVQVTRRPDQSVNIYVDGHDLVSEAAAKPIRVEAVTDAGLGRHGFDRLQVVSSGTGRPLDLQRGQIAGLLAVTNELVPRHLDQLDEVAGRIVTTVNDIHTGGVDLDGQPGQPLFDPAGTTAATMAVSDAVGTDWRKLAAAAPGNGLLDGTVAQQLARLGDSPDNPGLAVDGLLASVGSTVASLRTQATVAGAASTRAQLSRDSVSRVNLDEELTNLVEAQRAYESAARVLTTIDEALDTLINRTGLVGR